MALSFQLSDIAKKFGINTDQAQRATTIAKSYPAGFVGPIPYSAQPQKQIIPQLHLHDWLDQFLGRTPKPQSGMTFEIGAGLTPEQTTRAYKIATQPTFQPASNFRTTTNELVAGALRFPARAAASVLFPQQGGEVQPKTGAERLVFGDEPIKPIQQKVVEGELNLKDKGFNKSALPLAAIGVILSTTADLFPGLPEAEAIPKYLGEELINQVGKAEARRIIENEGLKGVTSTLEKKGVEIFNADKYVAEQAARQTAERTAGTPGPAGKISNFFKDIKSKLVDFNAPIEDVLSKAKKAGKFEITPQFDITNQIDRVLRAPTIAGQFARDNGLEAIIKQVDSLDHLDQYMIAKQALDVSKNGIETGRSLIADEKLVQSLAPKYEETAQIVNEYSQKLLDYSVESGLISQKTADLLKAKYPNYVPINRVFSQLEKAGSFEGSKAVASLSKQTVVQSLKGSERAIESPIASLLDKTAIAFNQGEKNKAARILAAYKDLPGNPFQLKELAPGELSEHTISFLDNGVKRTFETTQEISNAAKALNVQQLGLLGKIFAFPVRLAKLGITGINLPFIASNVAKDQVTAFINSKNALRSSIANPAVFTKSLFEAVGHGELYQEMAREGALGTSFDIARNQAFPTIEKLRSGKSVASKIKYVAKNPGELLRAVENIVSRSEELTRIMQYRGTKVAMLYQGMSEEAAKIAASRAARENTVNFARRGEWGQVLNSTFLYINANIQGTRTFLRTFKDKPLQTATKLALTVFTPVAAVTAWNLSDPERKAAYDDIADYEKQNNIVIIPDNPTKNDDGTWNVIKIPLSQEINNLANMPRRVIEQAFGKDPVSVKDIASALIGTISPVNPTGGSVLSTITPQAIKPTLEGVTNKNFFTGIPEVPSSLSKLSPELQAKPYTSGTARQIGGILKLSPIKIEEFIKGTVGGIGSQILHISDMALAGLDIIPKDQIGGQSVAKAILARFSKARGGHSDDTANSKLQNLIQDQADESFRLRQEAEGLYSSWKELPKEEANRKASELKQANPMLYDKLKDVAILQKKGLDYNDRLILQLNVTNGARAKFIWENLKAFKTNEEKNAYIEELRRKKIISDEIISQLRQLKAKGY